MAYDLNNPFSVCFNMMKIKYVEYDKSFDGINFLTPSDKVNVFIDLETVLQNLTMTKDIDKKVLLNREFPNIAIADILNLAGHYKRFFRGNHLPTRVFLYMTDFESDHYYQMRYNEDYRSYYQNKYTSNPRYAYLGDKLRETVLPDAKTISQFCPNVYLIIGKNIEGSLIPRIIGESDPSYKNVIIGGDIYATQYIFSRAYLFHFIRKNPLYSSISWSLQGYLKEIFKREVDQTTEVNLFSNRSFYLTLIAAIGERTRNVDGLERVGPVTVMKYLNKGIENKIISRNTSEIELIAKTFPEELREDLIMNFHTLDMEDAYKGLSEADKFSIVSQIEDRFDNQSLIQLNNTRFYNYPLILESITM